MLTFRVTGKKFELQRHRSKMITNKKYIVDLASLQDKKLIYDFAKELNFDVIATSSKSTRDRSILRLLKSTAIKASGFLNNISRRKNFLIMNFCDRLELLWLEKQSRNNFNLIKNKVVAILDKKLENKCISKQPHEILLLKC